MIPSIPPKKNHEQLHEYDEYLYKFRHLVGNAFCSSKNGEESSRAITKMLFRLLLLSKFAALLFGSLFIDDTV